MQDLWDITVERNPYLPPGAKLENESPKPLAVKLALALLGLSLFLAPVRAALRARWERPLHQLLTEAILVAIAGLWLYGLHRGTKWLWWVTTILLLVGVIGIPWDVARQGVGFQLALYYLQCVASIGGLVFLCVRASRKWYRVSV